MIQNQTLFQFFQWYIKPEDNFWNFIATQATILARHGITHVWLPPPYKSAKPGEPGYAVYDLYDLGEFDQKGSVRTLYGTKEEYLNSINALHENKILVLGDIVFNHRMGGDEKETVRAKEVDPDNRERFLSDEQKIEVRTRFLFPGRDGQYSSYQWHSKNFTGTKEGEKIYLFLTEFTEGHWDREVAKEQHNYDYLLGMDVEFRNPEVIKELTEWGQWFIRQTGVDGFRLDGLKHINRHFFPDWLEKMKQYATRDLFTVGEYFDADPKQIENFSRKINGAMCLFDIPLHIAFAAASKEGEAYDLRQLEKHSLAALLPGLAVTFVDNHDTQPLRDDELLILPWFRPHAYAYTLLRSQGIPCVFYPDLYGVAYTDKDKKGDSVTVEIKPVDILPTLLYIRRELAYGIQQDFWGSQHLMGWTREGTDEKPLSGVAVVITNKDRAALQMSMGIRNKGRTLKDVCGGITETVTLDENGIGNFPVAPASVSVWVDNSLSL